MKAIGESAESEFAVKAAQKDAVIQKLMEAKMSLEDTLAEQLGRFQLEAGGLKKQLADTEEMLNTKEESLEALRSQAKTREKRIGELEADCQAKGDAADAVPLGHRKPQPVTNTKTRVPNYKASFRKSGCCLPNFQAIAGGHHRGQLEIPNSA